MARIDPLSILYSKELSPLEFKFNTLTAPSMYNFINLNDVDALRYIATSMKYNGKMEKKLKDIDVIMRSRGFKKLGSGTNRIVYTPLEYQKIVLKIALDKVGMRDSPDEYANQFLLKPFVTKVFECSPCGTVASFERVEPIVTRSEFLSVADDIYDLLVNNIIGEFVLEDIGNRYFMNFGIRKNWGVVLLDFPYVYQLDGKKLFCTKKDLNTGVECGGQIDYDEGFNNLICEICGKPYHAKDLKDNTNTIKLMKEGIGMDMKVQICEGDKVIKSVSSGSDTLPKLKTYKNETLIKATPTEDIGRVIIASRPVLGKGGKPQQKQNNPKVKVADTKNLSQGIKITEDQEQKVVYAAEPVIIPSNIFETKSDTKWEFDPSTIKIPEGTPINVKISPEELEDISVLITNITDTPIQVPVVEVEEPEVYTVRTTEEHVPLKYEIGEILESDRTIGDVEPKEVEVIYVPRVAEDEELTLNMVETEEVLEEYEADSSDDVLEEDDEEYTEDDSMDNEDEVLSSDPNINQESDSMLAQFGLSDADFNEPTDEEEDEDPFIYKYGDLINEDEDHFEKIRKSHKVVGGE